MNIWAAADPVPQISEHALLILLTQIAVLIGVATALGKVANRFGLPSIVGELSAGIVLGPSILGSTATAVENWLFPAVAAQQNLLDAVGQIGILLLVGLSAAQLDTAFVRKRVGVVASVSAGAFVIPLGAGIAAGFLLPDSLIGEGTSKLTFAVLIGTALSASAVPVIAKTLLEMGLLHRNVGQLTLASGTVVDAAAWVMLSVVSAMATVGVRAGKIVWTVASLVLLVAAALLLLRPLVKVVLDRAEKLSDQRTTIATVVIVVLGCAAATQALHLEAILGAFVAGVVVGQNRAALLAPLRTVVMTVFAPLFLATAGLRVDLSVLTDPAVLLAGIGVLVVATASKFAGAYAGARVVRLPRLEAVALGAGLNARGAVEIVIAMVGLRLGVFGAEAYAVIVFVAVVTSVMAPPILRWSMARVDHTTEEEQRAELHEKWETTPGRE
ncbi:cation:proton antiporter [Rhodococcus sp. ACPA4]|nr:K/H antiporter [Rhodococcus sp. AD45]PBC43491.1 cation:proton antiporter [Rhodococcus sp. ACPA4]PSR42890.1 cation:proton antiporter [Rhodococcus sp. AD45-ID]